MKNKTHAQKQVEFLLKRTESQIEAEKTSKEFWKKLNKK